MTQYFNDAATRVTIFEMGVWGPVGVVIVEFCLNRLELEWRYISLQIIVWCGFVLTSLIG